MARSRGRQYLFICGLFLIVGTISDPSYLQSIASIWGSMAHICVGWFVQHVRWRWALRCQVFGRIGLCYDLSSVCGVGLSYDWLSVKVGLVNWGISFAELILFGALRPTLKFSVGQLTYMLTSNNCNFDLGVAGSTIYQWNVHLEIHNLVHFWIKQNSFVNVFVAKFFCFRLWNNLQSLLCRL